MGLVKDDGTDIGQNAGIGRVLRSLLDGEVGKEQVVVDDNDVALQCSPVHFRDKAALPRTAFLTEAGLSAGVQFVPETAGFGQRRQLPPPGLQRRYHPHERRHPAT